MKPLKTLNARIFRFAANLGSGILLNLFNPYKTGDFVEVEGQLGSVKARGFKQTVIKKIDGSEAVVNNSSFYTKDAHNLTSKNIIRLDLTLNVGYANDMSRVKEEITDFLSKNSKILSSPTPKIQVSKIKDDFVEIAVKPWCLLDHYLELDSELEQLLNQYLSSKNLLTEVEHNVLSEAKMMA